MMIGWLESHIAAGSTIIMYLLWIMYFTGCQQQEKRLSSKKKKKHITAPILKLTYDQYWRLFFFGLK